MEKLQRRPGETDYQYHKRLVYGKLVDGTLADEDYSELAYYIYGKEYSSDVARRMMYGSRQTLDLIDEAIIGKAGPSDIANELEMKSAELRKEKQKLFDQRAAFNKVIRERARQEEINELIVDTISRSNLPTLEYSPSPISASDNDLLVSLNDMHYGAYVDNYWCKYSPDICKDMLRKYLNKIIEIAQRHHSENCIVWENGDVISGNIHYSIAVTNKENVIEQITGAAELISEFVAELSKHFRTVRFVSVSGNHSRLNPSKELSMKDERLDDIVEWYMKARLQSFENVIVGDCVKIDETMYLTTVRGLNYVGVHGDYDNSPAKVQTLQAMAGVPVYAVLSGHMHHNKIDTVQDIMTIMAGSFLGMDDHCVSQRIIGKPEQLVCVCDAGGMVCPYWINF